MDPLSDHCTECDGNGYHVDDCPRASKKNCRLCLAKFGPVNHATTFSRFDRALPICTECAADEAKLAGGSLRAIARVMGVRK